MEKNVFDGGLEDFDQYDNDKLFDNLNSNLNSESEIINEPDDISTDEDLNNTSDEKSEEIETEYKPDDIMQSILNMEKKAEQKKKKSEPEPKTENEEPESEAKTKTEEPNSGEDFDFTIEKDESELPLDNEPQENEEPTNGETVEVPLSEEQSVIYHEKKQNIKNDDVDEVEYSEINEPETENSDDKLGETEEPISVKEYNNSENQNEPDTDTRNANDKETFDYDEFLKKAKIVAFLVVLLLIIPLIIKIVSNTKTFSNKVKKEKKEAESFIEKQSTDIEYNTEYLENPKSNETKEERTSKNNIWTDEIKDTKSSLKKETSSKETESYLIPDDEEITLYNDENKNSQRFKTINELDNYITSTSQKIKEVIKDDGTNYIDYKIGKSAAIYNLNSDLKGLEELEELLTVNKQVYVDNGYSDIYNDRYNYLQKEITLCNDLSSGIKNNKTSDELLDIINDN